MKTILVTLSLLCAVSIARAKTMNGNDFALFYSECKTDACRKALLDEAVGNPHYFRYLLIAEMDDSDERAIHLKCFEPSSLLDVEFVVTKRVSLSKLKEDPVSTVGTAIAITGVIKGVNGKTIQVSPVIVRHKDRLTPGRGKEMFYEIDASGTFYSYTGGKRPVSLTFQDRDLLQYRDRILNSKGKEAWAEFLEKAVAKRKKERAEKAKAFKEAQKQEKAAQP